MDLQDQIQTYLDDNPSASSFIRENRWATVHLYEHITGRNHHSSTCKMCELERVETGPQWRPHKVRSYKQASVYAG